MLVKENNQIILVKGYQDKAILTMKDGNQNIIQTQAYIGKNGLGKTKEKDQKTPIGEYELGIAFGIKENPRNTTSIYKDRKKYVLGR